MTIGFRIIRQIWSSGLLIAGGTFLAGTASAEVIPALQSDMVEYRIAHGLPGRPTGISETNWNSLLQSGSELQARLESLRARGDHAGNPVPADLLADAGALWRNVLWLLDRKSVV